MNNLPLPEPQLPRRSRLRCWLRHVQYDMRVRRSCRSSRACDVLLCAGIVLVLAAILVPVFARPSHGNGRSSCMSNLRHIGVAMQQYAADYDATLPRADAWMEQTFAYTSYNGFYRCPQIVRQTGQNAPIQYGYAYNSLLSEKQADTFPDAKAVPLCYDSRLLTPNAHAPGRAGLADPPRHGSSQLPINLMLFLDGHVGNVDALGKVVKPKQHNGI